MEGEVKRDRERERERVLERRLDEIKENWNGPKDKLVTAGGCFDSFRNVTKILSRLLLTLVSGTATLSASTLRVLGRVVCRDTQEE